MYGWLEAGGAFHNTLQVGDIILRTDNYASTLAIGNGSNTNAAVYVKENSVGVNVVPDPNVKLHVSGSILLENQKNHVRVTSNNLLISSLAEPNISLSRTGVTQAKVFITDDYLLSDKVYNDIILYPETSNIVLSNVSVESINFGLCNYIGSNLKQKQKVLIDQYVAEITSISETGGTTSVSAISLLPEQIQIPSGQPITLQVLKQANGNPFASVSDSESYQELKWLHVEYSPITAKVYIEPSTDITFFRQNMYLHFVDSLEFEVIRAVPSELYKVKEIYTSTDAGISSTITFQTASKLPIKLLPFTASNKTTYAFVDKVSVPRNIVEHGTVVGFNVTYRDVHYYISSSNLSKFSSLDKSIIGIDDIHIDNLIKTDVILSHNRDVNDTRQAIIVLSYQPSSLVVMRRDVIYSFIGIPCIVKNTSVSNDLTTYILHIEPLEEFLTEFASYDNIYLVSKDKSYIIPVNQTVTEETDVLLYFDKSYEVDLTINQVIFIIPFAYSYFTSVSRFGEPTSATYIPSALGIGTSNLTDRLTVDGTVSCHQLSLKNRDNDSVLLSYTKDSLSIGNRVTVTKQQTLFNSDVIVKGNMTCDSIFQISDKHMKDCIETVDPLTCLKSLEKIKIVSYKHINGYSNIGVIAQDVAEAFPDAVHHDMRQINVSPIPFRICNQIIIVDEIHSSLCRFGDDVKEITMNNGQTVIVHSCKKNRTHYEFSTSDCVEHLRGAWITSFTVTILKVNYQYLFSVGLSTISYLSKRVSDIEKAQMLK
jgi:hypothetical protein